MASLLMYKKEQTVKIVAQIQSNYTINPQGKLICEGDEIVGVATNFLFGPNNIYFYKEDPRVINARKILDLEATFRLPILEN